MCSLCDLGKFFYLSDNEEMMIYVPNTAAGVRGNKAFRIRSTKPGTGEELSPCLRFPLTTGLPAANTSPRSHQDTQMTVSLTSLHMVKGGGTNSFGVTSSYLYCYVSKLI